MDGRFKNLSTNNSDVNNNNNNNYYNDNTEQAGCDVTF
jgi:hypothetical protein